MAITEWSDDTTDVVHRTWYVPERTVELLAGILGSPLQTSMAELGQLRSLAEQINLVTMPGGGDVG